MEALTWAEILSRMFYQLIPVWIALIATFSISIYYKRNFCLLYTSPSPRDATLSRMPSSA